MLSQEVTYICIFGCECATTQVILCQCLLSHCAVSSPTRLQCPVNSSDHNLLKVSAVTLRREFAHPVAMSSRFL